MLRQACECGGWAVKCWNTFLCGITLRSHTFHENAIPCSWPPRFTLHCNQRVEAWASSPPSPPPPLQLEKGLWQVGLKLPCQPYPKLTEPLRPARVFYIDVIWRQHVVFDLPGLRTARGICFDSLPIFYYILQLINQFLLRPFLLFFILFLFIYFPHFPVLITGRRLTSRRSWQQAEPWNGWRGFAWNGTRRGGSEVKVWKWRGGIGRKWCTVDQKNCPDFFHTISALNLKHTNQSS